MIRIGTAGWVYKDWEGIGYPKPRPRGFETLRYLAEYFDTVEINSSFYGPPSPAASKKWLESIANNPNFRFTAKLFRSFTYDREPAPNDERDFKAGLLPLQSWTAWARYCCSFRGPLKTLSRIATTLSGCRNDSPNTHLS